MIKTTSGVGIYNSYAANTVTINGGTVLPGGTARALDGASTFTTVITGGSIRGPINNTAPTNGAANGSKLVYLSTVGFDPTLSAGTAITKLENTLAPYYSANGIVVDTNYKIYPYFPVGANVNTKAESGLDMYEGLVTTNSARTGMGTLTLTTPPVGDPKLDISKAIIDGGTDTADLVGDATVTFLATDIADPSTCRLFYQSADTPSSALSAPLEVIGLVPVKDASDNWVFTWTGQVTLTKDRYVFQVKTTDGTTVSTKQAVILPRLNAGTSVSLTPTPVDGGGLLAPATKVVDDKGKEVTIGTVAIPQGVVAGLAPKTIGAVVFTSDSEPSAKDIDFPSVGTVVGVALFDTDGERITVELADFISFTVPFATGIARNNLAVYYRHGSAVPLPVPAVAAKTAADRFFADYGTAADPTFTFSTKILSDIEQYDITITPPDPPDPDPTATPASSAWTLAVLVLVALGGAAVVAVRM